MLEWLGLAAVLGGAKSTACTTPNPTRWKTSPVPGVGGFWWSHLRWLWQAGAPPVTKYCRDLDTPGYRFWTRVSDPAHRGRLLHRLALWAGGVFLDGADSHGVRAACAVLRQQHLPSAERLRPGRSHRAQCSVALADAPGSGRELAPEPSRPTRLRRAWMGTASGRHRLGDNPAPRAVWARQRRPPSRRGISVDVAA